MAEISIIIPVFNARQYVTTTIKSVLQQTFDDWELIIVDDCSTDGSDDIIKSIAQADGRIHYMRQKTNGGPAKARNTALDIAQGKYLAFIDSDDTIASNALELLYQTAEKWNADVVWFNINEVFSNSSILRLHGLTSDTLIVDNQILTFFFDAHVGIGSMCNKFYRNEFIQKHGLRINPNRYHGEDWEFNLHVFKENPRVIAIEDVLYNYLRQNAQSVVSSYHCSDFDNLVRTMEMLNNVAEERGIEYDKKSMMSRTIYQIITILVKLSNSTIDNKLREYHRIANNELVRDILSSGDYTTSQLTLKQKVYFLLFRFRMYHICSMLIKIFK